MKTLAELKRRIIVGTTLRCVKNTKRPEMNGGMRTVCKVQQNGFFWTKDGEDTRPESSKRYWTDYPKASGLTWIAENTFRLSLKVPSDGYVELEIV